MAKPILVGNWKNYPGSLNEAKDILKGLSKKKALFKKLNFFLAPPTPYFETVSTRLAGFGSLAAQNLSSVEKGTATAELTPEILKSFGVRLAILGHSEQRALGETTEKVAQKIRIALRAGLVPLVCFGEKVRDPEGEYFEYLREELKTLLLGLKKTEVEKLILAYEPVWAIGNKSLRAIEPTELAQTILFIKKILSDLVGRKVAEKIAIIYGGSVDDQNAGVLIRNSGVRGFLPGRASLDPQKLEGIAQSMLGK